MFKNSVLASLSFACLALGTQGALAAGPSISHNDWELACDNTRTCRAAGYHRDGDSLAPGGAWSLPAIVSDVRPFGH